MAIFPTNLPVGTTGDFLYGFNVQTGGGTPQIISEAVTLTDPDTNNPIPARVRQGTPVDNDAGQVVRIPRIDFGTVGAGAPIIPGDGVVGWLRATYDVDMEVLTQLTEGVKIFDGTNAVAITPPNTAATAAEPALVVAISPNNPVAVSVTPNVVPGATFSSQPGYIGIGVVTTAAPTYATGTANALSLNTAGRLRVEASQTGTWSVDLGSINGTSPIAVGVGVASSTSMRVVNAQDANTIAGAAPGTAGTPSANVVSVQGVTGGTPQPVSGTVAFSNTSIQVTQGTSPWVVSVSNFPATQNVNLAQINGTSPIATGSGVAGSTSQRMVVAQDANTIAGSAPGTAGSPSSNVVSVQGIASGTPISANAYQGGNPVNATNPLYVQGTVNATGAALNILSGLSVSGYDLSQSTGAAYSASSVITGPYRIIGGKMKFTGSAAGAAKTIQIIDVSTGTAIVTLTNDTRTDIPLNPSQFSQGMTSGSQFQLTVSQLTVPGTCALTFQIDIENGQLPMSGNPVVDGLTVDVNNTSSVLLGANATFTGSWTDVSQYSQITVAIFQAPDQPSGWTGQITGAPNFPVALLQFSPDGVHVDGAVPVTVTNGSIVIPVPLRITHKYFRVLYTNGSTAQTAFRLISYLHHTDPGILTRTGVQVIQPGSPVQVVRALIEPGFKGRLSVLGADRSVGGETISLPFIIQDLWQFDAAFANNNITVSTSGGATATQSGATGAVLTSASASGASLAQLQGAVKIRYKPGREFRTEFSVGFPSAGIANSDIAYGLTDTVSAPFGASSNSLMFGWRGTVFGLHIVNGGTVTSFPIPDSINGDPLDSSALSEFRSNLTPVLPDFTKANAFRLRGVWFGVGPVYLEMKSPDDKWVMLFAFRYPNTATSPYIRQPNLYMCAEVSKTASAAAGTLSMFMFCANGGTVESEQGFEPHEINGHKQVQKCVASQSASVTPMYTVSTGRQLLVKSMFLNVVTVSQAANMRIEIRDGGAGGTLLQSFSAPRANNTSATASIDFPVPQIFLTDVTVLVVSGGTIDYDFSFVGYEKEL